MAVQGQETREKQIGKCTHRVTVVAHRCAAVLCTSVLKCQILMISHTTVININILHASVHNLHGTHCKFPPCFTKKYI